MQNGEQKRYQALLRSGSDGMSAMFHVAEEGSLNFQVDQNQHPQLTIRNLSVIEIPYPDIILRKASSQEKEIMPKISFTKINPTKYIISVKNASNPYTLVFLDAFH